MAGSKKRVTWSVVFYDLRGVEVNRIANLRPEDARNEAEEARNITDEIIARVYPPLPYEVRGIDPNTKRRLW
jgi:hypothetical protein